MKASGRSKISVPTKAGGPGWATGMAGRQEIDLRGLERDLSEAVAGEVRFDRATRALYATDSSNFRQPPIGVVIPRTTRDVVATHEVCHAYQAPILARGCGTSLSGETVNYAVVMDFSKYLHGIMDIDSERRLVRVQPGAINEKVNEATGRYGLVFGPDPSTHAYCTIGGNIGNNSCGIHSVQARFSGEGSRTSDNVHELEILTYDGTRMRVGKEEEGDIDRIVAAGGRRGEIYAKLRDLRDRYADRIRERYQDIPRRVSGYNLDELLPEKGFNVARALVGTEGTCVTVLEATLQLVPNPRHRALLVIGYEDIFSVGDHVAKIMAHRPMGCEAIDHMLFKDLEQLGIQTSDLPLLPEGEAWVLVEVGGETQEEADGLARDLMRDLDKDPDPPKGSSLFDDLEQREKIWRIREAGLAGTAFPPDGRDHWPG
ncbi:MAG TPA: FAD-binding oxidoreductase, partial [Actinomycetota bacterium]|nr:FAD-binding oxidoreductase [Actinomycetota bacterium]